MLSLIANAPFSRQIRKTWTLLGACRNFIKSDRATRESIKSESQSSEMRKAVAFKAQLPDIFVGQTHFRRALRTLKSIEIDLKVNNLRDRQRKHTASSLDALMKVRILIWYRSCTSLLSTVQLRETTFLH